MARVRTDTATACAHCGEPCRQETVVDHERPFCCQGCRTVYNLLHSHELGAYYQLESTPGIRPSDEIDTSRFAYLDDSSVQYRLLASVGPDLRRITLLVPQIHCAACIWLLENLYTIETGITASRVDFPRRELTVTFNPETISLRQLVERLASLGYEPDIRLASLDKKPKDRSLRGLYARLALAGFCFGNVMLLSFPEYLGLNELSLPKHSWLFGAINIALALPVLLYSATDFFRSAGRGLQQRIINMDVPISIGILILFSRSVYDIAILAEAGYMDSFTGLVFFLLIGRLYQKKTYATLSFDRDYKAYFPVAVIRKRGGHEIATPINDLEVGDRVLIRHGELIPADGVLILGEGAIDYSFVSGESAPVGAVSGDKVYAGGRQTGAALEIELTRTASQSYLMQLWSHHGDRKRDHSDTQALATRVSRIFTPAVLGLAGAAAIFWFVFDASKALDAATAVLIIACPCALALSTPFTLGTAQRLLGFNKFFVKDPGIIERLARISHIVFDKTGTITLSGKTQPSYRGTPLTDQELSLVASAVHQSTHPISQAIAGSLSDHDQRPISRFEDHLGKGIEAVVDGHTIRIGSASWAGATEPNASSNTSHAYVAIAGQVRGLFTLANVYRPGLRVAAEQIRQNYKLSLLSGDQPGEEQRVAELFGPDADIRFRQSPHEKLDYIAGHVEQGEQLMMIGDGLNDAGALGAASVGVAVTEREASFTPACDAIMHADYLRHLPAVLRLSRASLKIIVASFGLSFLYNAVGLAFAVSGELSPLVAAVLMPLSSVTVVLFATVATTIQARKAGLVKSWK